MAHTEFARNARQKARNYKDNKSYVRLEISCPACGKGGKSKWTHYACYRYLDINKYGYVRCTSNHGACFYDWKWDCGNHKGGFKETNPELLATSLRHLLNSMGNNSKGLNWYLFLIPHVAAQFGIEAQ